MRSNWSKILLIVGSLLYSQAFSQADPDKLVWARFSAIPDTAGIFPGEDLVLLSSDRIIRNCYLSSFKDYFEKDVVNKYGSVPISLEENFLQIYVRNERGARLSWQLQVGVMQERNLLSIRLRNRKPDGRIIYLSEEDTRYVMNQTIKTKETDIDYSYLPVPGVDAGDVIEIYSSYYIPGTLKSDEVYFHQYYPALLSRFTYEHAADFEISLMKYNFDRFDCRKTLPNDTSITYEFRNLPGLYSQGGIISQMELPFLVFRIDSILFTTPYSREYLAFSSPDWSHAIDGFIRELNDYAPTLTAATLASPDNFFRRFGERYPGATNEELALHWHRFLNDSISLRFFREDEKNTSMEHWLALRSTDRSSLLAWYMHYFNYLGIKYRFYISRELQYGYLDSSFVYSGMGTMIFFGIPDGGQEHYLFPRYETEKYQVDEFPSSVRGSIAVGRIMGDSGESIRSFQIPPQSRDENWKNRILHTLVTDPTANRLTVDQRSYFNGDFARSTRAWYDQFRLHTNPAQILENQMIMEAGGNHLLSFDIDWLSDEVYHHSLTYECDNFLSVHSDSSFSVRIRDVSPIDLVHVLPYKRFFGYYNLVPYYNTTRYYLEFDKPVEIIGTDSVTDYFENDFGSLRLKAVSVNEKMILIETHYSTDAVFLLAGSYAAVNELSDRFMRMQEKRVFIRYLP